MGGYYPVFAISFGGIPTALTNDPQALTPEFKENSGPLFRLLVGKHRNGAPPDGELTVRPATDDESGIHAMGIMEERDVGGKLADIQQELGLKPSGDANASEWLDCVFLER